jgi:hypothetical protein
MAVRSYANIFKMKIKTRINMENDWWNAAEKQNFYNQGFSVLNTI